MAVWDCVHCAVVLGHRGLALNGGGHAHCELQHCAVARMVQRSENMVSASGKQLGSHSNQPESRFIIIHLPLYNRCGMDMIDNGGKLFGNSSQTGINADDARKPAQAAIWLMGDS